MCLAPHSVEWYERLSHLQTGYFYPWRSRLEKWHGEDLFRMLVFEHLRPELDVLEVACAQGELALAMAPNCRSVLGYDVTPGYIDLARRAAAEGGIGNATFVVHNSAREANGGQPRLPAADHSIDLFVNSKGPWSTLLDVPRAGRPGAVLLALVPAIDPPMPWEPAMPEPLRRLPPGGYDPLKTRRSIEQLAEEAGMHLLCWWDFEVPEWFMDPRELYNARTFGNTPDEVPPYEEVAPVLEQIFHDFAGPLGLESRWHRAIFKAMVSIPRNL